jgi:hypothetical protein
VAAVAAVAAVAVAVVAAAFLQVHGTKRSRDYISSDKTTTVSTMSMKELRSKIDAAGLSHKERTPRQVCREALAKLQGKMPPAPPATSSQQHCQRGSR